MAGLTHETSHLHNTDIDFEARSLYKTYYGTPKQPPKYTYPSQGHTASMGSGLSQTQSQASTLKERPSSSGMIMSAGRRGQSIDGSGNYPENFVKTETNGDQQVMDFTPLQRDALLIESSQLSSHTNTPTQVNGDSRGSCCSNKSPSSPLSEQYSLRSDSADTAASFFSGTSISQSSAIAPIWPPYTDLALDQYVMGNNRPTQGAQNSSGDAYYTYTPGLVSMPQDASGAGSFENPKGNCACGLGCECLGCPEHPNNIATTNRVQELSSIMYQDQVQNQQSPDFMSPMTSNGFGNPLRGYAPAVDTHRLRSSLDYGFSSPQSPFIRDIETTLSPSANLPLQHFNDSQYITVQFDVPGESTCTNPNAGCMCGSDCECPDCLTHTGQEGNGSAIPHQHRFIHSFSTGSAAIDFGNERINQPSRQDIRLMKA